MSPHRTCDRDRSPSSWLYSTARGNLSSFAWPAVESELIRAVASKADRDELRRSLRGLFTWHPMPERVWRFVEHTQDELVNVGRHRGPSVVDLLVAGTAQAWDLTVLHADADFETIATVTEPLPRPLRRIGPPTTSRR